MVFETEHRPDTVGFALAEHTRLGRFNPERARELGVPEGPLWGRLHKGETVSSTTAAASARRTWWARRGAGARWSTRGDTRPSLALIEAARGADLLIHEATFGSDEARAGQGDRPLHRRGGRRVALEAGVRRLVLTHISPRYTRDAPELLAEARAVFPETVVARDGTDRGRAVRGVTHRGTRSRWSARPGTRWPCSRAWWSCGWSGIPPHDRFTWLLEVAPVLIGVPILIVAYPTFRLTPLVYTLLWIHAIILMIGGNYTYAEVPLGFWLQDAFGFARNHYDRIGHFAQGFIPAMLAREVFIRRSPLRGSRWLPFVVVCFCLAFSALYELIEFWTALATGEAAEAFLGTQGDVWDTQWDMQLALLGAFTALVTLSRVHDRQLKRISPQA